MKNIRLYELESEYLEDKVNHEYPTVSYDMETDTVYYFEEEKENYIEYLVMSQTIGEEVNVLGWSNSGGTQLNENMLNGFGIELNYPDNPYTYIDKMTIDNEEVEPCMTYVFNDQIPSLEAAPDLSDLENIEGVHKIRVYLKDECKNVCMIVPYMNLKTDFTHIDFGKTNLVYPFVGLLNYGMDINTSNIDTEGSTNMAGMFMGSVNITSLDVSSFDTSEVTNMQQMFAACQKITSLDLSNFDTSKVTNMSNMFYDCNELNEITMGGDIGNVTTLDSMFKYIANNGVFYYNEKYADSYIRVTGGTDSKGVVWERLLPDGWTAEAITM